MINIVNQSIEHLALDLLTTVIIYIYINIYIFINVERATGDNYPQAEKYINDICSQYYYLYQL